MPSRRRSCNLSKRERLARTIKAELEGGFEGLLRNTRDPDQDRVVLSSPESSAPISTPPTVFPVLDDRRTNLRVATNFFHFDNDVFDLLLPGLSTSEQCLYLHLYRLSYGWNRNWCQVSIGTLSTLCSVSTNTLKQHLQILKDRGYIKAIDFDRAKGTVYRVYLPCELSTFTSQTRIAETNPSKSDRSKSDGSESDLPKTDRSKIDPSIIDLSKFDPPESDIPGVSNSDPSKTDTSEGKAHPIGILGGLSKIDPSNSDTITDNSFTDSLDRHSLSEVVVIFYQQIGQTRIAKQKRERGEQICQTLLQDGFSMEDIRYACTWAVKNVPDVHSFSIIPEIIGQATAEQEQVRAKEQREAQQRRDEEKKRQQQAVEQRRREQAAEQREKMSKRERQALRKQAEARIPDATKQVVDPQGGAYAKMVDALELDILTEQQRTQVSS